MGRSTRRGDGTPRESSTRPTTVRGNRGSVRFRQTMNTRRKVIPSMLRRKTKFVLTAAIATALLAVPVAALAAGDTDDSVKPANTAFTDASKHTTFTGTVAGVTVTSTCTSSIVRGKTPLSGLVLTIARPSFTGCTDNIPPSGGTDTIKTFGVWKAAYVDAANDETAERNPDATTITIPKAGATLVSSIFPTCTITVAPNGPVTIRASYNDTTGVATFTNAPVLSSTSAACPGGATTSTAHFSASYKSTPILKDAS